MDIVELKRMNLHLRALHLDCIYCTPTGIIPVLTEIVLQLISFENALESLIDFH